MTITIYKNHSPTAIPYHKSVLVALERIRTGADLSLINQIRFEKDKIKQTELKKELCSFAFSGKFSHRSPNGLITHSGLICISMNGFNSEEELKLYRKAFIKSKEKAKYTFALFTSVSNMGLKALIKIPPEEKYHKLYFSALKEFYNDTHFEDTDPDVAALTFSSYDPDLYFNADSEIWLEKNDTEAFDLSEKTPILKLNRDIAIVSNLEKMYFKKFKDEESLKKSNVVRFCTWFNDFGIKKTECERYIFSKFKDTIPEKQLNTIINNAYKEKGGTKFFEDKQSLDLLERNIRSGVEQAKIFKKLHEIGGHSKEDVENAIGAVSGSLPISEFWYFTDTGKCCISNNKFKSFLEQRGFYKLYPEGSENFVFIKVENNLIENVTTTKIKDFVLDYLNQQANIQPYELMAGNAKFFKEDYLNLLSKAEIHFFEDTIDQGVIYFRNGAVILKTTATEEIEKTVFGERKKIVKNTKVELVDYLNINGYIWKHQIIDRDYKECDFTGCDYSKFINLIAGQDEKSELSIKSTTGYLMHSFKTSANNKAVILNDATISDNPNGGSGKGIYCAGLGQVKRLAVLNGKTFDGTKSFAYQTVSADTQLLLYDDIPKNFSFEDLFSVVTEGITLEKKNKDAIKLPVGKSPKIIITTNYTIGGVGGSHERRKWEIEFSSYFSSNHTPLNEFGHLLFDEWSEEEWNKFDNFMIDCFKIYLEQGLIRQEYTNLAERKFIKETSFDFHEWVKEEPLPLWVPIMKASYYERFLSEYNDYKHYKWFTQKKFSAWLEMYAKYKGYKTMTGKSIEGRWIKYFPEGAEEREMKEDTTINKESVGAVITGDSNDEFDF